MTEEYALRGGEPGRLRLDLLARTMAPTTHALLDEAGVRAGMRCVDVGCGSGHVSLELARRVGAPGRVVGLEIDAVKRAAAQAESARLGLDNLEFRGEDVGEWSQPGAYDLVYGRFILSHLANRRVVLQHMFEALRPGGVLIVEDIDFKGAFCHPPCPAFTRYCALYRAVVQRRHGDADLGPKLHGLCREVGLADARVRVVQPVHWGVAPEKALALSTLENIADAALGEGLASAAELRDLIAALRACTDDPASLIGQPRIFQVWGRRVDSNS